MNIGIFTDAYYPQINGVVISTQILKNELEKLGHNVTIVTVTDPNINTKKTDILRLPSIPFAVLPNFRVGSIYSRKAMKEIKKLGFLIKLDTNGTNPHAIRELLDLGLLDFVALDYKAPKDKFLQITHSNKYNEFSNTLDLLLACGIEFEVRTTLHYDLLNENDINTIIKDLSQKKYTKKYYIQEFLDTGINIANLEKPSKSFDKTKLLDDIKIIWR